MVAVATEDAVGLTDTKDKSINLSIPSKVNKFCAFGEEK